MPPSLVGVLGVKPTSLTDHGLAPVAADFGDHAVLHARVLLQDGAAYGDDHRGLAVQHTVRRVRHTADAGLAQVCPSDVSNLNRAISLIIFLTGQLRSSLYRRKSRPSRSLVTHTPKGSGIAALTTIGSACFTGTASSSTSTAWACCTTASSRNFQASVRPSLFICSRHKILVVVVGITCSDVRIRLLDAARTREFIRHVEPFALGSCQLYQESNCSEVFDYLRQLYDLPKRQPVPCEGRTATKEPTSNTVKEEL